MMRGPVIKMCAHNANPIACPTCFQANQLKKQQELVAAANAKKNAGPTAGPTLAPGAAQFYDKDGNPIAPPTARPAAPVHVPAPKPADAPPAIVPADRPAVQRPQQQAAGGSQGPMPQPWTSGGIDPGMLNDERPWQPSRPRNPEVASRQRVRPRGT